MHLTLKKILLLATVIMACGCASTQPQSHSRSDDHATNRTLQAAEPAPPTVKLASHMVAQTAPEPGGLETQVHRELLEDLEQQVADNPTLCRLWREYQAAAARVRYVDKLPDPKLGTYARRGRHS